MGTDINIYAERRVEGKWLPAPEPRIDPRSGDATPVQAMDIGRPYGLFSLLAGDGIGLMSRLTEMPRYFTSRGFPSDMCDLYARKLATFYDSDGGDGGASWLALRELEGIDWDRPIRQSAFVDPKYAGHFYPDGPFPESVPKDAKLYHGLFMKPPAGTRKVTWRISLREYVGCSEWFIDSLRALAGGEELRIIYWFDC